jgi:hypothetical protein
MPIEGADRIQLATIKAEDSEWQVIVDKSFKLGEIVAYIEYDCVIPETNTWAESLRKRCYSSKYRGFVIKAMKLKGVYSYGIVFHLWEIGANDDDQLPINKDMSEILGIKALDEAAEYEAENKSTQKPMTKWQRFVKKYAYFIWKLFYYRKPGNTDFPSYAAIKTDETRIQNLTRLFETAQGKDVYVTMKMDGQSATFSLYKGKFIIASRNTKKYEEKIKKAVRELVPGNEKNFNDDFIKIACKYRLPEVMSKQYTNITLQGELCGPGIQKNKIGLKENTLYVFNLFSPIDRRYYSWPQIERFCTMAQICANSSISTVPFIERRKFDWKNVHELEEYAKGTYENGSPREGVVIRAFTVDTYQPDAENGMTGSFSFKCINPEFAVKNG